MEGREGPPARGKRGRSTRRSRSPGGLVYLELRAWDRRGSLKRVRELAPTCRPGSGRGSHAAQRCLRAEAAAVRTVGTRSPSPWTGLSAGDKRVCFLNWEFYSHSRSSSRQTTAQCPTSRNSHRGLLLSQSSHSALLCPRRARRPERNSLVPQGGWGGPLTDPGVQPVCPRGWACSWNLTGRMGGTELPRAPVGNGSGRHLLTGTLLT